MENQNNQQQQFRCSGDGFKCIPMQRQYCAAQWSYNSMKMMEAMQETLKAMHGTVEELKGKIEAIQGNEAMLFDPTEDAALVAQPTEQDAGQETDTAQEGDGAKE